MELKHKQMMLEDGAPSIANIYKRRNWQTTRLADITFYEFHQRRADGLFRKYVFAFNSEGKNITSLVRLFLGLTRFSRQRQYWGALMSSSDGLNYSDSLVEGLRHHGYRNYSHMIFRLILTRMVWVD